MTPETVSELRRASHDLACRARAVSRLVWSDEFAAAYARASDDGRAAAARLIRSSDRAGLDAWVSRQRGAGTGGADPGTLTLRELRALGQRLGVRRYNQLPKAQLLSEIAHATKRRGTEAPEDPRPDAAAPARGGDRAREG